MKLGGDKSHSPPIFACCIRRPKYLPPNFITFDPPYCLLQAIPPSNGLKTHRMGVLGIQVEHGTRSGERLWNSYLGLTRSILYPCLFWLMGPYPCTTEFIPLKLRRVSNCTVFVMRREGESRGKANCIGFFGLALVIPWFFDSRWGCSLLTHP